MPHATIFSIGGRRSAPRATRRRKPSRPRAAPLRYTTMDDDVIDGLIEAVKDSERIVVAGGPRTGKSSFTARASERLNLTAKHADRLLQEYEDQAVPPQERWSRSSREVAGWLDSDDNWILEGVVTPRALDHWMQAHPDDPVPATVIWFRDPIQAVTNPYHISMIKGTQTIWSRVMPQLLERGTKIVERDR